MTVPAPVLLRFGMTPALSACKPGSKADAPAPVIALREKADPKEPDVPVDAIALLGSPLPAVAALPLPAPSSQVDTGKTNAAIEDRRPVSVAADQDDASLAPLLRNQPRTAELQDVAFTLRLAQSPVFIAASKAASVVPPTPAVPAKVTAGQTDASSQVKLEPDLPAATTSNSTMDGGSDSRQHGDTKRESRTLESEITVNQDKPDTPAAAAVGVADVTPPLHQAAPAQHPAPAEAPAEIARPTMPDLPLQPAKAGALREITIQLPGAEAKPVDLHIIEDRGKVHVEVRTSDTQLASSLRDNVGDLVQKLDHSGFRTESVSTHKDAVAASPAGSQSQFSNNNGNKPAADQEHSDGRGGGQPGQQRQQEQGRGNRPRWLEEIVRNFHTVQEQESTQ